MEKKLLFALTLTLAWNWGETSKRLDDSDFDLAYNDQDFDDFVKFLGDNDKKDKLQSDINGFKRQKSDSNDVKSKHSIDDFKELFKSGNFHNDGDSSDDEEHEISEGITAKAVTIKGGEERKYKKGTKTRGFHRIRHSDDYKKDKEIYEDDETSGVIRKKGIKELGLANDAGNRHSQRSYHGDYKQTLRRNKGFNNKVSSNKLDKVYSDSKGFDAYFGID